MGIFDSIKNAFGKGENEADVTKTPSDVLREAGIDPSGLKFGFSTGSITVSGPIARESDRQRILDALSDIEGIDTVEDRLTVAAAPSGPPADVSPAEPVAPDSIASEPAAAEPPSAEPTPSGEGTAAGDERTYTVVSGDTLWRIAEREYGKGSEYMKIYEANTDVLEHPDRIFPGQKLRIPKL
jgi:nucleoid-associated protein YgaU